MAVTITRKVLCHALRLGDSPEELAQVERLLAYATTAVERHVETCPDEIHNESVMQIEPDSSLINQAPAGGWPTPMRSAPAGPRRSWLPWRTHKAGKSLNAT